MSKVSQEYGLPQEAEDEALSWEQIRRFLEAPLRRPLTVFVPWAGVILLAVAALFILPAQYKSATLILVESEKVPESFVPKVATQDRWQLLEAIKPQLLSRTRLETVLEETRPYPAIDSRTRAVEELRKNTSLGVSGNDGFTIEFVHGDPRKAQEVTNRLATLFIEETVKARGQQVEEAVEFLVSQVTEARQRLEKKDEALRVFKEARMGTLPEQLQTNLATLSMLQRELQTVDEGLLFARERQETLARAVARPEASSGGRDSEDGLADLRQQLVAFKGRYSDEHPDVRSLSARIRRMEARLAEASDNRQLADTPASVTREQLERAKVETRTLEERRANIEGRIAVIRTHVEETPRTEQELATLMRDSDKLNENYTALLSKQLEAQMAGRLERRWKGDRFRMLDPAYLPEKPFFPNPVKIIGLGIIVGLFAGIGVCLFFELLDPTVRDTDELSALGRYPVLARIPHLPELSERSPR